MDKRLQKVVEDMANNALDLDDTFQFKCRTCGNCCKNRHDIMLTTRDIYNIARTLGRTMQYVVERYCDVYIGHTSRIPIVRLMPVGSEQSCPLMRNRRCIVHKAKPVVCALYPLGRGVKMDSVESGTVIPDILSPIYFIQSDICGTRNQTHTLRGWLEEFGIPVEDEFYALWTEKTTALSNLFHKLEDNKIPADAMELLWKLAVVGIYIHCDTEKDIIPQFQENAEKLLEILIEFEKEGSNAVCHNKAAAFLSSNQL